MKNFVITLFSLSVFLNGFEAYAQANQESHDPAKVFTAYGRTENFDRDNHEEAIIDMLNMASLKCRNIGIARRITPIRARTGYGMRTVAAEFDCLGESHVPRDNHFNSTCNYIDDICCFKRGEPNRCQ